MYCFVYYQLVYLNPNIVELIKITDSVETAVYTKTSNVF